MQHATYAFFKRVIDILVSTALIGLFLPFWIVIPMLIKLDSKGPVVFKHKRVGINKKPFYMYKFRSMIDGAHEYLHIHNPNLLAQFKAGDWKLENDPRITKLGKVLRSLSIDEFPQLINVLKGDMSMVGHRAYMAEELKDQFTKHPQLEHLMETIHTVKPGLTGPWQVSGRNDIPFIKRVQLDAQYAKKKSILVDIEIILKTPKAMFSKW